jgi:hypothetical protein
MIGFDHATLIRIVRLETDIDLYFWGRQHWEMGDLLQGFLDTTTENVAQGCVLKTVDIEPRHRMANIFTEN